MMDPQVLATRIMTPIETQISNKLPAIVNKHLDKIINTILEKLKEKLDIVFQEKLAKYQNQLNADINSKASSTNERIIKSIAATMSAQNSNKINSNRGGGTKTFRKYNRKHQKKRKTCRK